MDAEIAVAVPLAEAWAFTTPCTPTSSAIDQRAIDQAAIALCWRYEGRTHAHFELWPKVGEGVNWGRRHIVGVFEPPLLHRRSDSRRSIASAGSAPALLVASRMLSKSRVDRASRSRGVTIKVSPGRSALMTRANAARSATAPETFSLYTFAAPASRNAASCVTGRRSVGAGAGAGAAQAQLRPLAGWFRYPGGMRRRFF